MSELANLHRLRNLISRNRARETKLMEEAAEATRSAHESGIPETVIALALGVNRMTVRKWLGK